MTLKAYKAFHFDLSCRPAFRRPFFYKVGEDYEMPRRPKVCVRGFHYCFSIYNLYQWYPTKFSTRICEIGILGDIDSERDVPPGSKASTNHIRIIRELEPSEILENLWMWMCADTDDFFTHFLVGGKDRRGKLSSLLDGIEASLAVFRVDPRGYRMWEATTGRTHYPTRKERSLLEDHAAKWRKALDEHRIIKE